MSTPARRTPGVFPCGALLIRDIFVSALSAAAVRRPVSGGPRRLSYGGLPVRVWGECRAVAALVRMVVQHFSGPVFCGIRSRRDTWGLLKSLKKAKNTGRAGALFKILRVGRTSACIGLPAR